MITWLTKIFIKENQEDSKKRQMYGILCGMVGIALNIILFVGKLLAGTISNSIAITADAFNNLSDAGSSFVTLIGFKLAGTKPDPEHPFGHGRIEYISGLVVAGVILIMAFELIRNSINKIIHPQTTEFSFLAVAILMISILVKLYMSSYNRKIGTKIGSAAMKATATDSLSDTCATTVVLVATLVAEITGLQIDGYCGVLVGIFILYAGINAGKETLNPLLGQPPAKEFVDEIEKIVMSYETIQGIHDLVVHDYGPGRVMISLHAEVPAEGDIMEMHDVIDNIETKLREKLHCAAVIHMDPIATENEEIIQLKKQMIEIIKGIDETITLHDFRMVAGPTHNNIIFDIAVPFKFRMTDESVIQDIRERARTILGDNYYIVVQIDKAYC